MNQDYNQIEQINLIPNSLNTPPVNPFLNMFDNILPEEFNLNNVTPINTVPIITPEVTPFMANQPLTPPVAPPQNPNSFLENALNSTPQIVPQQDVFMNLALNTNPIPKIVDIPSNLIQSGITKNYTNYSYYYGRWSQGSAQRVISEIWNHSGRTNDRGIATLNGRYLVAMSPIFGNVGNDVNVLLEDGTVIPCTIADAKGTDAKNTYGHVMGNGSVDVIEWESFGSKDNIMIDDWRKKKVVSVVNINLSA